eukprot:2911545-Rhodomonas_salina.1
MRAAPASPSSLSRRDSVFSALHRSSTAAIIPQPPFPILFPRRSRVCSCSMRPTARTTALTSASHRPFRANLTLTTDLHRPIWEASAMPEVSVCATVPADAPWATAHSVASM